MISHDRYFLDAVVTETYELKRWKCKPLPRKLQSIPAAEATEINGTGPSL